MIQLQAPSKNLEAALVTMATIRDEFARNYQKAIQKLLEKKLPIALCTVYNPCFHHKGQRRGFMSTDEKTQRACEIGLVVLNDVIIQTAIKFQLPLIELRSLFTKVEDYANPIEPSVKGGEKMVSVMYDILNRCTWQEGCSIYPK